MFYLLFLVYRFEYLAEEPVEQFVFAGEELVNSLGAVLLDECLDELPADLSEALDEVLEAHLRGRLIPNDLVIDLLEVHGVDQDSLFEVRAELLRQGDPLAEVKGVPEAVRVQTGRVRVDLKEGKGLMRKRWVLF